MRLTLITLLALTCFASVAEARLFERFRNRSTSRSKAVEPFPSNTPAAVATCKDGVCVVNPVGQIVAEKRSIVVAQVVPTASLPTVANSWQDAIALLRALQEDQASINKAIEDTKKVLLKAREEAALDMEYRIKRFELRSRRELEELKAAQALLTQSL